MKDFKSGGFRGGDHRDRGNNHGGDSFRSGGDRPAFKSYGAPRADYGKKPWDKGGKSFGGDKEMFNATCASCGKPCQVPFRPVDGRPVYCKDCFMSNDAPRNDSRNDSRGDFKPAFKKDFNQGSAGGETYRAPKPDPRMNDILKQLESMNSKLDKLVGALTSAKGKSEVKAETVADVIAKATDKSASAQGSGETKKGFKMAKPVKTTKKVVKKTKK